MNIHDHTKQLAVALVTAASLGLLGGCMTVSSQRGIVENTTRSQTFANKRIAVLPVKAQTSLAPDSVIAIRAELNRQLGQALHGKLPGASLIDFATVSNQLNEKGVLPAFEQLVATYENTGVIDRQKTSALGRALGSEFLLLARLKAEKVDIMISKATGTSLEVSLINAETGAVTWGGSSEWKRGGIFGFGDARPDETAKELVNLALSSLQVEGGSSGAAADPSPVTNVAPSAQSNAPADSSVRTRSIAPPQTDASATGAAMTLLEAQKRLADRGYDPGVADGKMGSKTANAFRQLQRDRGLRVTGVLDTETQSALRQ